MLFSCFNSIQHYFFHFIDNKKEINKNLCDSVNHTRFPKEDHPPDLVRRDNKVTQGDRVHYVPFALW